MKPSANKGNSVGENNTPKQRKTSSKNGEIETYLSSRYEFRYNTVLGRTEYRSKEDAHFSKVGRYEINTLRRELDNDVGIITSSDNLYSIIEKQLLSTCQSHTGVFQKVAIGGCKQQFSLFTESHSRLGKLRGRPQQ